MATEPLEQVPGLHLPTLSLHLHLTSIFHIRSMWTRTSSTYAFDLVLTPTSLLISRSTAPMHTHDLDHATDLCSVSANLLPHLTLMNITSVPCSLPHYHLHVSSSPPDLTFSP